MLHFNMVETTQEAPRASKCPRKLYLSAMVAIPAFCIAGSLTTLVLSFVLFCTNCPFSPYSPLVYIYWAASVSLFLLGAFLFGSLACSYKKQVSTPRVVISSIPAEDLEKSPAPTLRYNHLPRGQWFAITPSTDLPDYFTAVKNTGAVYSPVGAEVWTEDETESPPPSYEDALEMITSVDTTRCIVIPTSKQGNTEDTRF